MTLTVRLDPALEDRFNELVRKQRRTKSEVVTELLTRYVDERRPRSAADVAMELAVFEGPVAKMPTDLARNHKKYLAAALAAKHRR